ncbi:MAG TPA: hypothetical protein VGN88_03905 [Phycisphaerae bacterium]
MSKSRLHVGSGGGIQRFTGRIQHSFNAGRRSSDRQTSLMGALRAAGSGARRKIPMLKQTRILPLNMRWRDAM